MDNHSEFDLITDDLLGIPNQEEESSNIIMTNTSENIHIMVYLLLC